MSNPDYEALTRMSLCVGSRLDLGKPVEDDVRQVLIVLADWLDEENPCGSNLITSGNLRKIANAKPDPLDGLSPEDRLGYVVAVETANRRVAESAYITRRDAYIKTREACNQLASVAVAEFQRQQEGR